MKAINPGEKNRIVCMIHQIVYSHFAINNYAIRLTLCNPNTNTLFPANFQPTSQWTDRTACLAEFWISGVSAPSAALIIPRRVDGPVFNYLCHFLVHAWYPQGVGTCQGCPPFSYGFSSCCRRRHQLVDNLCCSHAGLIKSFSSSRATKAVMGVN